MNNRSRFVPPLAAALLLGAALMLRFFWPGPHAGPSVKEMSRGAVSAAPASAPLAQVSAPATPPAVKPAGPRVAEASQPRATVVPLGPGDVPPEPEVANPPPQRNDPIEPEKPQTAAWKHEKMVRLTQVMTRDVARLEQERKDAESRGDTAEAKRLAVQLSRHQARLGQLNEQTAALADEAAHQEPQAP
ncbi:hypothetical protein [Archangium sp.]|uniref:hypothetical protein n=1 Tax=Archangium sp. TaxID=1872627 RepID=UPI003899A27E